MGCNTYIGPRKVTGGVAKPTEAPIIENNSKYHYEGDNSINTSQFFAGKFLNNLKIKAYFSPRNVDP